MIVHQKLKLEKMKLGFIPKDILTFISLLQTTVI